MTRLKIKLAAIVMFVLMIPFTLAAPASAAGVTSDHPAVPNDNPCCIML